MVDRQKGAGGFVPMGRGLAARVGVFALAVLLLGGCALGNGKPAELAAPLFQPLEEKAETSSATRGTIETRLRGSASFVPARVTQLAFGDTGGVVKAFYAEIGKKVESGEAMAELDTGALEERIQLQKLNVERATLLYKEAIGRDGDEVALLSRKLDLERESAALRTLENTLLNSGITAPFEGIVTFAEKLEAGSTVQPYQIVASVADPSSLQLVYTAKQPAELLGIVTGMPVEVTYKGAIYEGTVVQAPSALPLRADPRKRLYHATRIVIGLDQLPPDVVVGHSADIAITLQQRENVIIVPRNAVYSLASGSYVQILEQGKRLVRDVETGLVSGGDIEIVEGVEEGQQVVVNP
ncbi:efflux RND transporter periplasmic adaptor subunit [Paenibacillus sp. CAU 1782]